MDELRYALRGLVRQPGFASVAVLTLAFGIAVNTSLFSLVSAFFLQPLPVRDAGQLVLVMQRGDVINVPYGHSYPDYLDYRRTSTVFSALAAYMPNPVHLSLRGRSAERTWIEIVSPNYFSLAGATPALGQFPRAGDPEGKGGAPTIVLSYRYWQRRFGADPSLVGRNVIVNGRSFVVSGVAPASFTGLSWAMAVSGWVPAGAMGSLMDGGDAFRENRGAPAFRIMGRLAPGRTVDDARAEIGTIARRLASSYPEEHKGTRPIVIPESRSRPDPAISDFLPVFAAVFTALVALVLLIACANVANLMIARALARHRDLVIRSALGASRSRLIRFQLVEATVLALAGGVLGLLLAHWGGGLLSRLVPTGDIPVVEDRPWDWRVWAFTGVMSVVAGVATGLWPAWRATRFDLVTSLKEGSAVIGSSRHRLRNLLVVGQVMMSLVVLVSAGLFLRSLRQMETVAIGFRSSGLLMMSMDPGLQQYGDERGRRFIDALLERAEALPGVASATVVSHVPFDYGIVFTDVSIDGNIPGSKDGYLVTAFNAVGPTFFETAGVTTVRGRRLDARDDERSRPVAVVNETMARTLWPGREAVGQHFRFGRNGDWIEVIGVAADGKYMMIAEAPRPYFYVPISQRFRSPITLILRSASDPGSLTPAVQRAIAALDPDLPVYNVRTMDKHMASSVFGLLPMRLGASIAGAQGLIGLLLALMGLYAVVSYAVSQRTREIGVRIALGAARADVLRLVVREGMRLSLVGIAVGLLLATGLSVILSKLLYGLPPLDPVVFGGVTVLLVGVSVLACYVPARRAARLDPLVSLRAE
jgi:putative ABC transport system permease protein